MNLNVCFCELLSLYLISNVNTNVSSIWDPQRKRNTSRATGVNAAPVPKMYMSLLTEPHGEVPSDLNYVTGTGCECRRAARGSCPGGLFFADTEIKNNNGLFYTVDICVGCLLVSGIMRREDDPGILEPDGGRSVWGIVGGKCFPNLTTASRQVCCLTTCEREENYLEAERTGEVQGLGTLEFGITNGPGRGVDGKGERNCHLSNPGSAWGVQDVPTASYAVLYADKPP